MKSARELFAAFDPRPVAVSSPHNPDECFRRLAKVTTDRGDSWYLSPKTAMLPDPLSRGEVRSSWIQVALLPIGFISFAIFVIAPNKRSVRVMLEKYLALLHDITKLLDATSTFPD